MDKKGPLMILLARFFEEKYGLMIGETVRVGRRR